jgi:hypothetical protein
VIDFLAGLAIAVVVLAAAYALTMFFWRAERNIDRPTLGHWFRSLIRLYEPDSVVRISHRGSSLRFTLRRREGQGSQCWVVVSCPRAPWTTRLDLVRESIAREPRVLILRDPSGRDEESRLDVQVSIGDIWASDAADVALRVVNRVLDAFEIGAEARFDLEFMGEHSIERAFEARRRQRDGSLEEW